jgi:hypothetical protein
MKEVCHALISRSGLLKTPEKAPLLSQAFGHGPLTALIASLPP